MFSEAAKKVGCKFSPEKINMKPLFSLQVSIYWINDEILFLHIILNYRVKNATRKINFLHVLFLYMQIFELDPEKKFSFSIFLKDVVNKTRYL